MEMVEYKKTGDYQKAKKLVCEFIEEVLDGKVDNLLNADLYELIYETKNRDIINKYVGDIKDPDMYLITQAIYIIVWGNIYELTFDKLGSWGKTENSQYPFRGDTMNSFKSVYGDNGVIAKRYNLDKNTMDLVNKYHKLYHSIGNFIVIPNRKNVNSKRANYYTIQDFYDSFIGVIYQFCYPEKITEYSIYYDELVPVLKANDEYRENKFETWIKEFFLESYIKNGQPYNVFDIDIQMRKKEYIGRNRRSKDNYYTKEEYALLAQKYYETSKQIIDFRANKILSILVDRIKEIS